VKRGDRSKTYVNHSNQKGL